MTKKDYILLAQAIKGYSYIDLHFINHLCSLLKKDNPSFDKERFLAACGFLD